MMAEVASTDCVRSVCGAHLCAFIPLDLANSCARAELAFDSAAFRFVPYIAPMSEIDRL